MARGASSSPVVSSTILNSVGGIGLPTEPTRLSRSSSGMKQNAGPASVMPQALDTIAFGSLSCSVLTVPGATGALPSEQMVSDDRSASAKRGEAMSSSAIAGTMKVALGWRCSTTSNQASTSNLGMYSNAMPSFIGLYVEAMPANVNIGDACSQPFVVN